MLDVDVNVDYHNDSIIDISLLLFCQFFFILSLLFCNYYFVVNLLVFSRCSLITPLSR